MYMYVCIYIYICTMFYKHHSLKHIHVSLATVICIASHPRPAGPAGPAGTAGPAERRARALANS